MAFQMFTVSGARVTRGYSGYFKELIKTQWKFFILYYTVLWSVFKVGHVQVKLWLLVDFIWTYFWPHLNIFFHMWAYFWPYVNIFLHVNIFSLMWTYFDPCYCFTFLTFPSVSCIDVGKKNMREKNWSWKSLSCFMDCSWIPPKDN